MDELSRLNEELSQQSEELSRQSEELTQQNEQLSQQSEELAHQNEELQTQSGEIQALIAELTHREDLLQKLLDATRLAGSEQAVVQDVCAAALGMFGPPVVAVAVYEKRLDRLLVLATAGLGVRDGVPEWRPAAQSFPSVVIDENRTACLSDTSLRPDLSIVEVPGHAAFSGRARRTRATVGPPVWSRRRLQSPTAPVDGRAIPPGRVAGRPVRPHPGNPAAARRIAQVNANLEQRVAEQIGEIRQASEVLKKERQRLHDVLDMLPVYTVLLTPDYHVPFANRFFEERFGKSEGRRCYEYLFNRTEPCENCETYTVLKTNTPQRWEWTGPDGRNYDIFDFPFTDSDGSPLIMEVGVDVTERKRPKRR